MPHKLVSCAGSFEPENSILCQSEPNPIKKKKSLTRNIRKLTFFSNLFREKLSAILPDSYHFYVDKINTKYSGLSFEKSA